MTAAALGTVIGRYVLWRRQTIPGSCRLRNTDTQQRILLGSKRIILGDGRLHNEHAQQRSKDNEVRHARLLAHPLRLSLSRPFSCTGANCTFTINRSECRNTLFPSLHYVCVASPLHLKQSLNTRHFRHGSFTDSRRSEGNTTFRSDPRTPSATCA